MDMERERDRYGDGDINFWSSEGELGGVFGAPKASREFRFASQRLWTSDFDALEAAGAPRSDQESPKKPPRRPQVTIHRLCRWIMSSQGAAGNPQKTPKELLGSENGAQESSEEPHKGLEERKRRP